MMFQYSFDRVLDMKKREKEKVEQEYQQSVSQFESVALSLYKLLRQKEQMETAYNEKMAKGVRIQELQHNEKLLFHLQHQITDATARTDMARDHMYRKEDELQKASIEWKRYEKMKERAKEEYDREMKKLDNHMMDEISIRNYAFAENR